MEQLFQISDTLARNISDKFQRSLATQINWKSRLVEIKGARGVGKTTLLLQYVKKHYLGQPQTGLYISLDDPYFYDHSLVEFTEQFVQFGGEHLFLDEVHKYPAKHNKSDWSRELKVIYDRYPQLKIVYTGSSILELYHGHGDLSRRRSPYTLAGLSFREYLALMEIATIETVSLENILRNHQDIAADIAPKAKVIRHFNEYLQFGYYPFYQEDPESYFIRIKDVISLILESDLPAIIDIPYESIFKIKRLLAAIASTAPYIPNFNKLRQELNVADHRTLLKYLSYLENAEVIATLQKQAKGNVILRKPQKIYLHNPNFMYAVVPGQVNKGNLRETFFLNQVSQQHTVTYQEKGDFLVDHQYTFEVGGKNKQYQQISGVENGFIAADDIEYGFGQKIPLWMFGLLY